MAQDTPELHDIVAAVVRELLAQQSGAAVPDTSPRRPDPLEREVADAVRALWSAQPQSPLRPLPGLDRLAQADALPSLTRATPSRIGVGRAGLRYPTATYLALRADHGTAKDAVASEVAASFVQQLGAIELRSRATDLQGFLLQPDLGRALDDASLQRLRSEGTRGVDVQIIVADGLSAWAAERNPSILPALQREIGAAGFSVGRPIWVHRARIAVADQIGVELGAKATVMALGERPGLGSGDSMSLYIAWNPKIGQDNAEKNCISNVRPAGLSCDEAAKQAAQILSKARELGQGGLAVATPRRTW
jgi:ethanolamine ammonia-lyase small subunit